jgi:S-DNA-T family DNA segregation ATPase FtsK/SpoIIIE
VSGAPATAAYTAAPAPAEAGPGPGKLLVHRPARIPPPRTPEGEIVLAPPPKLHDTAPMNLLQSLLPTLAGLGSLLYVIANPNPVAILAGGLFAASAVLMGVGLFVTSRSTARRRVDDDRARYQDYLDGLGEETSATAAAQRAAAWWRHPAPANLWRYAHSTRRLWERRPSDSDAMQARVGIGSVGLATPLMLRDEDNPLIEAEPVSLAAARALVERRNRVHGMPLTVPLGEARVLSVLGPRASVLPLATAFLAQLVTFHSPRDLRIAVACDPARLAAWDWCKWLPHAQHERLAGADGPARLLATDAAAFDRLLGEDLAERRTSTELPGGRTHLVLVLDLASHRGLDEALWAAPVAGLTVVHLGPDRDSEPPVVDWRLELRARHGLTVELGDGTIVAAGAEPDELSAAEAEALARSLSPLTLSAQSSSSVGGEASLQAATELTDLLGITDLERFDAPSAWARPRRPRDFLHVPIGVGPDGAPVRLDLKESALGGMGPHGLMIGATGSGKSELLRTLVTALALTHPPDLLSFMLVDFKGGAAFAGLAPLPHVAGLITNLADDLAMIERAHDALLGEKNRRLEVLKRAGNLSSISQYHELRAAGEPLDPLPVLLVVIDEFGELLATKPEYVDLFGTIGRVGRSLGIHLLFASQRLDDGRLRGLDSHLSYRIALRTFSAAESRQLIGTEDAYKLPSLPGSGYLKVDTTVYQRFRAALVSGAQRAGGAVAAPSYVDAARASISPFKAIGPSLPRVPAGGNGPATEPHADPQASPHGRTRTGVYPDLHPDAALGPYPGNGSGPYRGDGAGNGGPRPHGARGNAARARTVLDVAVDRLRVAAPPVRQVWLPPLPEALSLGEVLPAVNRHAGRGLAVDDRRLWGSLRVPVGVVDRPSKQVQEVLALDLSGAAGNLGLTGAPQSGKSMLLRTLLTSFALTHTPEEVQFYCLDHGGGGLAAMAGLPHVGGVATGVEPERARRILAVVSGVLRAREELFRQHGIDSMPAFRALRAAGRLPGERLGDVFLVIDNWPALSAEFDDADQRVLDIANRGLGYGVHVLLTANRSADIRPKLKDALGCRLELKLGDPLDSDIDRKAQQRLPEGIPGRGLCQEQLLFQTALPSFDGASPASASAGAMTRLCAAVADAWTGRRALPVRILPAVVTAADLPAEPETGPGSHDRRGVVIGLGEREMAPVRLDLRDGDPHFLVFGDGESGKTSFLRAFLRGLVATTTLDGSRVVMIDLRRTLLETIGDEWVCAYAGNLASAEAEIGKLRNTLLQRLPPADLSARQLRERSWWQGPDLYVVVDDYDLIVNAGTNPLGQILDLIPHARDIGLHLILARRIAGSARTSFEPVLVRVREMSEQGLILSGDPSEGPVLGGLRATPAPPGRGRLIRHRAPPELIQVLWVPDQ